MAYPIIPWLGGKRRLADIILSRFPQHSCYVEVFAGGAALYFLRQPADVEVINDINGDVVNLYRVVKSHLEEFVRQFKWALSSREIFKWTQDTPPETLTDIQRAARFYYLQHQAFGGRVQSQTWGTATTAAAPTVNLLRLEESLSAAHLRLHGAYIERLDWKDCLRRYDRAHTFFYLDPPHLHTAGPKSWLAAKYGKLSDDWRADLRQGFAECFRVLSSDGVLVFKWNEAQIKVREVLALTQVQPLFGHPSGRKGLTHWIVFMKSSAALNPPPWGCNTP